MSACRSFSAAILLTLASTASSAVWAVGCYQTLQAPSSEVYFDACLSESGLPGSATVTADTCAGLFFDDSLYDLSVVARCPDSANSMGACTNEFGDVPGGTSTVTRYYIDVAGGPSLEQGTASYCLLYTSDAADDLA